MSWADFQGILEIASLPEGPLKHKNVLISGISKHALSRILLSVRLARAQGARRPRRRLLFHRLCLSTGRTHPVEPAGIVGGVSSPRTAASLSTALPSAAIVAL